MGLLDSIGNTARKAQLGAEIKLIERERNQRIKALGVELYDLIRNSQDATIPHVLQTSIQAPLEACTTDVRKMKTEVVEQKNDKELIEVRPDKDKGPLERRVGDRATITKINTRIAYLEREMRLRKEKFGLQVWDTVSEPAWLQSSGSFSSPELAIQQCVDQAKDDIQQIDKRIQTKLDQIAALKQAPTTAVSS